MSLRISSRVALLLAALLPCFFASAQANKKVLFDAAHAQMAGNADWVIDEDSCGNPQRFPTPAQSGITSSTTESYWNGAYSAFGVDLAKAGYQLETLSPGVAITYGNSGNVQDLSNYKVFVIPEPNVRFTSAEKSAIVAFVQNGGGLFMISDHSGSDRNNDGWDSPMIFNDLGADTLFGIHYQVANEANNNINDAPDDKYTADPSSVIVKTGPFGACSAGKGLGLFNSTTLTLNTSVNPSAKGHIWARAGTADTSTQVTFATATYGSGRVAAIGDSSPSEDATNSCGHTTHAGWTDTTYDNAKIHLNAIAWLAAGGASCTDTTAPSAAITAPTSSTVSGSVTISATGSDNVGVTGMTLAVDGATVATSTVSAIAYTWNTTGLAAGSTHTITATAKDACGNVSAPATKSVTIASTCTDTTPPSVAVTAPANGATVSATVAVSVTGTDNVAVTGMTLRIDGVQVASSTSGSLAYSWATAGLTNGSTHTLSATASDACGNSTTSSTVTVTVDNGGSGSIVNGGFETGSLSGWTPSGAATVVTSAHSGAYAAQLGSSTPSTDISLAQTFTLPANASQLSFWVKVTCPDTLTYDWTTATLKDNVSGTTATVMPKTCTNTGAWSNVTYSVASSAGHGVTLTFANHDDGYAGDATFSAWDDVTVTTGGGCTDSTPPTAAITSPASGATLSGTVTVNASGTDNVAVTKTEIYLDGALLASANAASASTSWTTTSSTNGGHTLTAKTYDGCGNVTTSAPVSVTVSNSTGCAQQLIGNGGFETGSATPWTATSGVVDNSTSEPAHAGSWKAWLDGYGSSHTDTLSQTITIPTCATAATLSFWLHVDTAETGTTAVDTLSLQVKSSAGAVLATLATYSNTSAASGYVQKVFSLTPYVGQTIQIVFTGTENSSNQTSFVVDDVAVNTN